jgi:hypothetical protein
MLTDTIPRFYLPRDVAKILKCSEWWVKEQARRRRIPYCWIGGGYRFTPEHLTEIVRIFERTATGTDPRSANDRPPRRRPSKRSTGVVGGPTQLTARIPARARLSSAQGNEAA